MAFKNAKHHPSVATVTTTPTLVVPANNGTGSAGYQWREAVLIQNKDASASINLRFGDPAATPYALAAGLSLGDSIGNDAVYADVASGTAQLYVDLVY